MAMIIIWIQQYLIYIQLTVGMFQQKFLPSLLQQSLSASKIHFLDGDLQNLFKSCCQKYEELQKMEKYLENIQKIQTNLNTFHCENEMENKKNKKYGKYNGYNQMDYEDAGEAKNIQVTRDREICDSNRRKNIKKDGNQKQMEGNSSYQEFELDQKPQEKPFVIEESMRRKRKTKNFIQFLSPSNKKSQKWKPRRCPVKKCQIVFTSERNALKHMDKYHKQYRVPVDYEQNIVVLNMGSSGQV